MQITNHRICTGGTGDQQSHKTPGTLIAVTVEINTTIRSNILVSGGKSKQAFTCAQRHRLEG